MIITVIIMIIVVVIPHTCLCVFSFLPSFLPFPPMTFPSNRLFLGQTLVLLLLLRSLLIFHLSQSTNCFSFMLQPIIIRTEKSEEPVGGGGAASRGRSFGSSSASSASANKTTITGQLLGSKERSLKPVNKQQQQQQQSGASAILTDEEDIADLLVELAGPPPSSVDEDVVEEAFNTDFQRLTKGARGTAAVSTVAAAAAGSNSTIKRFACSTFA